MNLNVESSLLVSKNFLLKTTDGCALIIIKNFKMRKPHWPSVADITSKEQENMSVLIYLSKTKNNNSLPQRLT